jgi:hypothetical protein
MYLFSTCSAAEYDRMIGSLYNSFSCGYSWYSVAWGMGLKLESNRPGSSRMHIFSRAKSIGHWQKPTKVFSVNTKQQSRLKVLSSR